ncbi:hypothetical protein JNUCC31_31850 [Paenibacillus sp. JNUCC31]|uniref:hypothetical protein n=1 Tax=Paenibacillus sp. JNUCC-31 TaxID=2777983 RepID=UPI001782AF15|nr:hypothetical protein [Paenibacillus sp. JNUCC-31]QOS79196.1 hypothetical protein JNUCC31_31850 [Paenibacillus sp. JNUCC-31]
MLQTSLLCIFNRGWFLLLDEGKKLHKQKNESHDHFDKHWLDAIHDEVCRKGEGFEEKQVVP